MAFYINNVNTPVRKFNVNNTKVHSVIVNGKEVFNDYNIRKVQGLETVRYQWQEITPGSGLIHARYGWVFLDESFKVNVTFGRKDGLPAVGSIRVEFYVHSYSPAGSQWNYVDGRTFTTDGTITFSYTPGETARGFGIDTARVLVTDSEFEYPTAFSSGYSEQPYTSTDPTPPEPSPRTDYFGSDEDWSYYEN